MPCKKKGSKRAHNTQPPALDLLAIARTGAGGEEVPELDAAYASYLANKTVPPPLGTATDGSTPPSKPRSPDELCEVYDYPAIILNLGYATNSTCQQNKEGESTMASMTKLLATLEIFALYTQGGEPAHLSQPAVTIPRTTNDLYNKCILMMMPYFAFMKEHSTTDNPIPKDTAQWRRVTLHALDGLHEAYPEMHEMLVIDTQRARAFRRAENVFKAEALRVAMGWDQTMDAEQMNALYQEAQDSFRELIAAPRPWKSAALMRRLSNEISGLSKAL